MSELLTSPPAIRPSSKEFLAFSAPFMVIVGTFYLEGYWGSFQINALEYIFLADVIKLAIYPLMGSLILFLSAVAVAELSREPTRSQNEGNNTTVRQKSFKYWRLLLGGLIVLIGWIAIYMSASYKWLFIAILFSLFSLPLSEVKEIIEVLPNARVRKTVLLLFLLLPALSFAFGKVEAYFAKIGAAHHIVDVERSKLPLQYDEKNRVAYLGLLGDHLVLLESKTSSIVFLKLRDDLHLFLVPNKASRNF
jgi:hypothetical protein